MREFFGIGGYMREPEGYLSPAHLIFVSSLMLVMIAAAVAIGFVFRKRSREEKLRVIAAAAILMGSIELFKIVLVCWRVHSFSHILIVLPLFLCSIPLFTLPLAAFGKGRFQEASLDFTFIFGLLIADLRRRPELRRIARTRIRQYRLGNHPRDLGFCRSLYRDIRPAEHEKRKHRYLVCHSRKLLRSCLRRGHPHPLQLHVPDGRRRHAV